MIGTGIVTAAYIALNTVYMYVLPLDKVASSTRIAADAADALVGSGGGAFLSAIVVFSTFGALAGIILSGPRVYFAMAKDGLLFFSGSGGPTPRYGTPAGAILLQAAWSSILVATGSSASCSPASSSRNGSSSARWPSASFSSAGAGSPLRPTGSSAGRGSRSCSPCPVS